MSSIKDVAKAAGVSTATVSRVLSNKPHVKQEIRNHVLKVVESMNYRPNRVARNLRAHQSSIIGLIVSDIQNSFFQSISRAVEDAAHQQGYSIILCNSDENPEKEAKYIELMMDENVAGLILSPTLKTADNFDNTMLEKLPVVVIDRKVKDFEIDSVLINNVESASRLVDHLISHGRKRIAGMFGKGSTTGRERYEGYLVSLAKAGIEKNSELIRFVNARENDGYEAMLELLDLNEPPDAIFISNSLAAGGALAAIKERKVNMPEEIVVGCFDDTIWARLLEPPLTVIEQPTYEIGKLAAELMIKRLEDPSRSPREVTLKGKLIIRQSCGCNSK